MPNYPTRGQFGGSPYNNPQMGPQGMSKNLNQGGGYQGGPLDQWKEQYLANRGNQGWGGFGGGGGAPGQGGGWGNTQSPMYDWQQGFAPGQASWQGAAPGHQGQGFSYNPQTGESGWVTDPTGLAFSGGGRGTNVSWIDPETGMRTVNPYAMQEMMGAMGGGGTQGGPSAYQYQGYSPSSYSGQDVTPGAGYGGYDYGSTGSSVDPSAVIAAQEAGLQERMEGDMARAGGRAGQSGFAMSTPYMGELGEAARKASQDRTALTMKYQYGAAEAEAQRNQQQQMQAAQLGFGGWQTGYQGDLQSQMFNQGQGLNQWMAQNQMGMQGNQQMNQFNQQQSMFEQQQYANQQNQQNVLNQQLMASLMGGLF